MAPPKTSDKPPPAAAASAAPESPKKHVFDRPKCALEVTTYQDLTKQGPRPLHLAWNCNGDQVAVAQPHCITIIPTGSQAGSPTVISQRCGTWAELLWRPGNDKQLAVLTDDKVILYDLRSGKSSPATKWEASVPAVERGAWCPDGKALVVLLNNGDLAALAGDSKRTLHRMANKNPDPQHTYSCISFRPDGLLLAGTFSNGNIEFIKYSDAAGFSVVGKMFAHSNACLALATSPDAKLLASGSMDATMLVWRTSPYVQLAADLSCDQPVNSLSWGPDSTSLAFTGDGAGVFVVDTSNAGGEAVAFMPSCKLPMESGRGYMGPIACNPVKQRQMAVVWCKWPAEQQQRYEASYNGRPPDCFVVRLLQLGPPPEQGRRK